VNPPFLCVKRKEKLVLCCRCMFPKLIIGIVGQWFIIFFIILYFSKRLSPAGSCEDLVDNVMFVCYLDEEVDIVCWLLEKSGECSPSITVVD